MLGYWYDPVDDIIYDSIVPAWDAVLDRSGLFSRTPLDLTHDQWNHLYWFNWVLMNERIAAKWMGLIYLYTGTRIEIRFWTTVQKLVVAFDKWWDDY